MKLLFNLRFNDRCSKFFTRCYSENKSNVHKSLENSLNAPLFNIPQSSKYVAINENTRTTTLPNGLKVSSQNQIGSQCAMGEKLAFHDRSAVQKSMDDCNSIFDCQVSRDFIIYAVSGFNKNMDKLAFNLAETVLRAHITPEEIDMAQRSISFELQALQMGPPVEPILNELVHAAAFGSHNTLGFPKYCPENNLGAIKREHIINFVTSYYRPERMVIAGTGIDHDLFVKTVEKYFIPTLPTVASEVPVEQQTIANDSLAQYTGGIVKLERDLSQYHSPMPEYAHVVIGFESCGYMHKDFVPICLLHSLMGGGGSFSAGGPGKGMYSKLYLNVLNEHHWVNSAQAENHTYTDTGLFTVIGSSVPEYINRLVFTLISELRRTVEQPILPEELERAKRQLQSMLLMNLETRVVNFEDIARQVLTTSVRREPEYWVDCINKVDESSVREVLHRMLVQSPVTLAGFGRLEKLPSLADVSNAITNPVIVNNRSRFTDIFKRFV